MKVLLLSDFSTPQGGAEIYCLQLRDLLRTAGHEARLLSSDVGPKALRQADAEFRGSENRVINRLLQTYNPFARAALKRELKRFAPDVVQVNMFLTQFSPAILPCLRDVPVVYFEHTTQSICPTGKRMLPCGRPCAHQAGRPCLVERCVPPHLWTIDMVQRWLLRQGREAFDVALTNSHHIQGQMQRFGGIDAGVQRYFMTRPPTPVSWPEGDPTVCYIGRLVPEKGVDVLLTAFATLRSACPNAQLLIAGAGPDDARLKELAQRLKVSDAVHFLGLVPNDRIGEIYAKSHVQAIPSLWPEPFGIVAREAMAAGRAVVATSGGGLEESVIEGETGFLVPSGDTGAFAKRLTELLTRLPLAARMGAAAIAALRRVPDNAAILEQHLTHYRRAISAR
ncbi:MAG: glycosyltransferase family 4 protein [Pseudomonadota bacterium]